MMTMGNALDIERIYGDEEFPDAYRILVDRLWPRGVSKVTAHLDEWDKTVAPSPELRTWFGHDPEKFEEFAARYRAELGANPDAATFVTHVGEKLTHGDVILLFGAKDETHNQAVVLRDYLQERLK